MNFTPRQIYPQEVTHRIGGWMGNRDGLEDLDGGKIYCHCPEMKTDTSSLRSSLYKLMICRLPMYEQ